MSSTMHKMMAFEDPPLRFVSKFASSLPVDGVRLAFYGGCTKQQIIDSWITRNDLEGSEWSFKPGIDFWTFELEGLGDGFQKSPKYDNYAVDAFKAWPTWLTGTIYMSPDFEQPPDGQGKPCLVFYLTRRSVAMGREPPDKLRLGGGSTTTVFMNVEGGMSTSFHNWGQAGNIGPSGTVSNSSFVQQNAREAIDIDWSVLAQELADIRKAMRRFSDADAENLEHDQSIGKIAEAEAAARKGNAEAVKSSLKQAGQWALEVATKIGVSVATKVIQDALHN